MSQELFCNDLFNYSRWKTREVKIGDITIGGDHPILVQSMTTTDTMDTRKTVEQSIRMIDAGCKLVRITAPSIKEAENLKNIKNELVNAGYNTPLVADIHFTPNAAEIAARIVEKVRVNPGNYADRKKFEQKEYSDSEYAAELERIRDRFIPLVKICKEYGTAMRIGTNHGSLSDRIMNRYGDTALGMVESAMEFIRICEAENFYNIVLSMKASNTQVMVSAYRLLVSTMKQVGMNYPLHLGVTEAGDGEDGRIKSSVGIGTLLEDGLGDTIRVSLTEEPEAEIPVAEALVARYSNRKSHEKIKTVNTVNVDWYNYQRKGSEQIDMIGGNLVPVVIGTYDGTCPKGYSLVDGNFEKTDDIAADYFFSEDEKSGTGLKLILDGKIWNGVENTFPLYSDIEDVLDQENTNFLILSVDNLNNETFEKLSVLKQTILILESTNDHWAASIRKIFLELKDRKINIPVIMKRSYKTETETAMLHSGTDFGSLLIDGFGEGIWMDHPKQDFAVSTSFGILQATRTRISKTEFISCPSCGRTLFDLQETTEKIRARTGHLKGVKIAIMGCIVNGPGEMADADYGYVGTGEGVISLYKGQNVVKKNIPAPQAVDALVKLIDSHGDWIEPKG